MKAETALVNSIIEVLTLRLKGRAKFWRNNTGALPTQRGGFVRFGALGSPDILGMLSPGGRLVCLEVKTKTGKVTAHQAAWLKEASALGALAGIVRSVEEALDLVECTQAHDEVFHEAHTQEGESR